VKRRKNIPAAETVGGAPPGTQRAADCDGAISCAIHDLMTGHRGTKLTPIKDEADFEQRILGADRPALVVFYKGGCPTCLLLHPGLNHLAEEYRDRVLFASFEIMKPYFMVTAKEVKKRYRIAFYPTVILFVGGQEKKRWILRYNLASYRKALDAAIGRLTPSR
jgi:thiol-disulfide isomerase/thioredoxin